MFFNSNNGKGRVIELCDIKIVLIFVLAFLHTSRKYEAHCSVIQGLLLG